MDDVITVIQAGAELQRSIFYGTVRALNWIFLYFSGEAKDSVSVKKLKAGEDDWTCVREVLG